MKKTYPLSQVYRLLEPGPVVMVTTAVKGVPNIMTMSWHMMIDFVPPLVGCIISNRNHSFKILKATKQCVINIPSVELASKVVDCGNTSGRTTDKFKKFRLTPVAATLVEAPKLSISKWRPAITCLFLRYSRPGLLLLRSAHGRFIISGEENLWSLEKLLGFLPK